ncbi:putative membrane protein [Candidatus Ichthyocystis hellenicum]|uniref:Putative membrane protein n=1 Tax=Candidatus Ichthyocystis hellenicum TaxID=1561003 RepID=A0A0S4MA15_9BURK|nr:putative membrane protein [Candidatus Ichthyocystis hellenicum]
MVFMTMMVYSIVHFTIFVVVVGDRTNNCYLVPTVFLK